MRCCLNELAKNPGAGGVASMGAGMGMAMSAAPIFASLAQQMFGNAPSPTPSQPTSPTHPFGTGFGNIGFTAVGNDSPVSQQPTNPFSSFGSNSATEESPQKMDDFQQSLQKLKYMLDQGFITQDAYNAKIAEIMGRM